jgi:hypothetical protein
MIDMSSREQFNVITGDMDLDEFRQISSLLRILNLPDALFAG